MGEIIRGDCLEELAWFPDNSVDAIVTDPPYGLRFMNKHWDYDIPKPELWREVLRVLKPGGHALIACGTRTQHRMAVNIEDAGFEIRDVVTWLYGSGFPKSLDVSKAIDKAAGVERELLGYGKLNPRDKKSYEPKAKNEIFDRNKGMKKLEITAPATDAAKQWQGFGTALKPACEFWTLARKPLSEKTVAANVLKWGTGGINVDASRIGVSSNDPNHRKPSVKWKNADDPSVTNFGSGGRPIENLNTQGRFPANLILDEHAAALLDEQSGTLKNGGQNYTTNGKSMFGTEKELAITKFAGDSGGASRFFYCAKASKSERNAGLEGMPEKEWKEQGFRDNETTHLSPRAGAGRTSANANHHPTVKPIKLMEYLVRLICPPNGTVLDPFAGSGSTGVAAKRLGFKFIGIEREAEYVEIAQKRIRNE